MVDPPIRVVSEQSEADIERNRTSENLGIALRAMAANLLRVIRGAGKSYELPRDMAECVRLFQAYYDAHAMWPDSFTFQQALDFDAEDQDRLNKDMTERDWEEWHIARAEYDICKASLQLVASRLIHQPVQERRGHSDLYEAIRRLEEYRDKRRARYSAEAKGVRSKTPPRKKETARRKPGGVVDI